MSAADSTLTAPDYQGRASERDWRATVRDAAVRLGWRVVMEIPDATYRLLADAVRSDPARSHLMPPDGWPDLVFGRGDRVLFVEFKTGRGRLSRAQTDTLDLLRRSGAEVHLWRPTDSWDDILEVLR